MQSVRVRGRFVNEQNEPVEGTIKFVPSKIWIEEGDLTYPTFAPEVALHNGFFDVELTTTDTHPYGPWHYMVECPIGTWSIHVEGQDSVWLKDLLPGHAGK